MISQNHIKTYCKIIGLYGKIIYEVIIIKEIYVSTFGRDICKSTKPRIRLIPNATLVHFIEEGSGYYNGIHLTKGQGFICPQNVLCDYIPDVNDPWTYSWINITGEGAKELISNLPLKNGVFEFDLSDNIETIRKIKQKESHYSDELRCLGVLFEIFGKISHSKEKESYVSLAKDFFKNNYHSGITVDDCAHALNISRAYLRNLFFKETGLSPQKYLMTLKMNRAEFLLKTDYPITEIAHAVGYDDVLQFSRIFSTYHGKSPKAYRKEFYESF